MSQARACTAFPPKPRRAASTWRRTLPLLGLASGLAVAQPRPPTPPASAPAVAPAASVPAPPQVQNSELDGPLLYQLLLAEFARGAGNSNDAIELLLEAGRHDPNDQIFRRALQVAVESGSGDKALTVVRAWRQARPRSTEALRTEVQLLFALGRVSDAADPLRRLMALGTPAERQGLLASLPHAAASLPDRTHAIEQVTALLKPYLEQPETRPAAQVALGRLRMAEGRPFDALELATQARAADPGALGPVLLALDVMNALAQGHGGRAQPPAAAASQAPVSAADIDRADQALATAETQVRVYLARPDADPLVRQAFAGLLAGEQRLSDAAEQLRLITQARPGQAQLWLSLGEVEIELHHPGAAEAALGRALGALSAAQADREAAAAPSAAADDDGQDADGAAAPAPSQPPGAPDAVRPAQVQLQLARAALLRHDDRAAAQWLDRIGPEDTDLQVIAVRASLLRRQGKLAEARALIQAAPAATPAEVRYRRLTEAQLLVDAGQLDDARTLLAQAVAESPDDVELLYQQAMVDERLGRLDEMEALLHRILTRQPGNSEALNALGYSLADRNLRLDEALDLVRQAHALSPGDPYIVDSLGWVQYRLGHYAEAETLLGRAYAERQDTEIGAHLGEVLWVDGRHDEALQVLREAQRLDAGNEVLRQTLSRLKIAL